MSIWQCNECKTISGPTTGKCPKCGGAVSRIEMISTIEVRELERVNVGAGVEFIRLGTPLEGCVRVQHARAGLFHEMDAAVPLE